MNNPCRNRNEKGLVLANAAIATAHGNDGAENDQCRSVCGIESGVGGVQDRERALTKAVMFGRGDGWYAQGCSLYLAFFFADKVVC